CYLSAHAQKIYIDTCYPRGCGTDLARLSCSFHSKWIMGTGCNLACCFKHGQILGPWQAIVPIRCVCELPVVIVDSCLKQRLANSLHDSTMYLSFHDHWVDDISNIIYRDKPLQIYLAGLLVY